MDNFAFANDTVCRKFLAGKAISTYRLEPFVSRSMEEFGATLA